MGCVLARGSGVGQRVPVVRRVYNRLTLGRTGPPVCLWLSVRVVRRVPGQKLSTERALRTGLWRHAWVLLLQFHQRPAARHLAGGGLAFHVVGLWRVTIKKMCANL